MKAKVNIKNASVAIQGQINIDRYGIHILQGKNGSGKSSVLRELAFNCNDVEFTSDAANSAFQKNRGCLFSYIEQNPQADLATVKQYLLKYDKENSTDELIKYFRLDYLNMNENVSNLSGGELARLNIIAQIKQDTPYIFFDEPSNNLDDASTELLMKLVKKLSVDHSIIIVTHDPRLQFEDATIYEIEGNSIRLKYSSEKGEVNKDIFSFRKRPLSRICLSFLKNRMVIFNLMVFAFAICLLAIINISTIYGYFNFEELPETEDFILCYEVDDMFGDLNRLYTDGEGLSIEESKYSKLITYDDLLTIIGNNDVRNVIIPDAPYIDALSLKSENGTLLQDINILSVPSEIFSGYSDFIVLGVDVRAIDSGRYPRDNMNEICVSKNIIEKFFKDVDSENPLGNYVVIEDQSYQIVGTTHEDFCLISYSAEDTPYGFVSSDNANFNQTISDNIKFLKSEDVLYTNVPSYVLINTKENKEKAVLNWLMMTYPANNYCSYVFASAFAKNNNDFYVNIITIVNITVAFLMAVLMFLLLGRMVKTFRNYFHNIDIYYLTLGGTKRLLYLTMSLIMCIFYVIVMLGLFMFNNSSVFFILVKVLTIPFVFFLLSLIVSGLIEMNKNE